MNREQKINLVTSLKEGFEQSAASFLINFRGLTVNQVQSLRSGLRSQGGRLKVAKARLLKMAAKDLPELQVMLPYFKEQIGVVFVKNQAPSVAKVLSEFAKKYEALGIVVGSLEHRLLDKNAIERIASLPPREVLLAQLCGTLQAPIAKLPRTLKMVHVKLLWTLKQVSDKKS